MKAPLVIGTQLFDHLNIPTVEAFRLYSLPESCRHKFSAHFGDGIRAIDTPLLQQVVWQRKTSMVAEKAHLRVSFEYTLVLALVPVIELVEAQNQDQLCRFAQLVERIRIKELAEQDSEPAVVSAVPVSFLFFSLHSSTVRGRGFGLVVPFDMLSSSD